MPDATRESLTGRLSRILFEQPIGAAERARAARHLLDWLACALAGLNTEAGAALRGFGRTKAQTSASVRAPGALPALGVGPLDRESALLINGALGNILEMDDIHRTAILHPGPVVAPVALTLAIERGLGGHACLDAIVRGYDAMIRVGRSLGRGHYRAFHPTATAGAFGAAAAAGDLLGLDAVRLRDALGHAGSVAGGLWQTRLEPSMTKSWHNACAARHGVLAAELAAHGFTAPAQILEGKLGLYAAMCPNPLPAQVAAQGPWALLDTGIKPWPACRHAHPALEAALRLRPRLAGRARVCRVLVETYDEALRFCDQPEPATVLQAKFSLQHVVAFTLVAGAPGLDDFDDGARQRPDVLALRRRIEVRGRQAFSEAFPERYGAEVLVWTEDRHDDDPIRVQVDDALGDPARPLDDDDLLAKVGDTMRWAGLKSDEIEALTVGCLTLADDARPAALAESLLQVCARLANEVH
ncbi:MAG: MmgE/PrpD family protein [Burkholderiaceae bacterium]